MQPLLLSASLALGLVIPTGRPVTGPACSSWSPLQPCARAWRLENPRMTETEQVVSPFEQGSDAENSSSASEQLELTVENVDLVLEDMRPYLVADGGNVAVRDIKDGVVMLELQGACGSCPSSTMTMKMGLERGLREKIAGIVDVINIAPEGPVLEEEGVEEVLEEIRPFLKMAGGDVELVELTADGVQPTAKLSITGNSATIQSVRVEIAQRLKRTFPTLANVEWA
jgi:Fe-S cluster biogenesis protein NfuA